MTSWSKALGVFKAEAKTGETHSGNRGLQIEEALLFERDSPGRCGVDLPEPPKVAVICEVIETGGGGHFGIARHETHFASRISLVDPGDHRADPRAERMPG